MFNGSIYYVFYLQILHFYFGRQAWHSFYSQVFTLHAPGKIRTLPLHNRHKFVKILCITINLGTAPIEERLSAPNVIIVDFLFPLDLQVIGSLWETLSTFITYLRSTCLAFLFFTFSFHQLPYKTGCFKKQCTDCYLPNMAKFNELQ